MTDVPDPHLLVVIFFGLLVLACPTPWQVLYLAVLGAAWMYHRLSIREHEKQRERLL